MGIIPRTTDPTVNDDSNANFAIGDTIINTITNEIFVCTDKTSAAAIWPQTGSDLDDHTIITSQLSTVLEDSLAIDDLLQWNGDKWINKPLDNIGFLKKPVVK